MNWLAIKNNVPDISKMVTSLASILRYSLNRGNDVITVEDELRQVKSYITIQKIRFSDKFDVYYRISQDIFDCKIIKLILQPLVENAIIHGIETYQGKGYIEIRGFAEGNEVVFEVENNGNAPDLDKINSLLNSGGEVSNGYGIKNVNERLKLYYGEEYGLSYRIQDGNTVAVIRVPRIT
nr:histidine kinase [Thermosediminibacter oceani]